MSNLLNSSIELEQDVLGTILLAPNRMDAIRKVIDPADFAEPIHRAIFEAMTTLVDTGGTITPTTIRASLGALAHSDLGGLTIAEYIARLMADAGLNSTLSGVSSAVMLRRVAKLIQIEQVNLTESRQRSARLIPCLRPPRC